MQSFRSVMTIRGERLSGVMFLAAGGSGSAISSGLLIPMCLSVSLLSWVDSHTHTQLCDLMERPSSSSYYPIIVHAFPQFWAIIKVCRRTVD